MGMGAWMPQTSGTPDDYSNRDYRKEDNTLAATRRKGPKQWLLKNSTSKFANEFATPAGLLERPRKRTAMRPKLAVGSKEFLKQ